MAPPLPLSAARIRILLLCAAILLLAVPTAVRLLRPPSFEAEIRAFLADEHIAGAVTAIGPIGGGPTVLAFGEAAPGRAMRPSDRFRLASLSKPVTAAAVLALVHAGRIGLDAPVAEAGHGITVRQLLEHSGGWDRAISGDPIADPSHVAALGISGRYDCVDLADRLPPAEFRPGSRYAYSNLGYCRLGQMIARLSGESYETYVEQVVLRPRGAHLVFNGAPTVRHPSDWPSVAYAALGPGGGWTGSAADYWRFATGPIDPHVSDRPPYAVAGKDYYGLGWHVWPDGSLTHFGAISGVYSVVVRADGQVAVLLFNGRPRNDEAAFARLRRALARWSPRPVDR